MGAKGTAAMRVLQLLKWGAVAAVGLAIAFCVAIYLLASRSLPDKLARRLEERAWDLHAFEPYRPDFLAGFKAELYGVNLEEGYAAAAAVMDLAIRRDVRRDIGGDAQRIYSVQTDRRDVTFKHVLLPVWIAAYRYRGKPYRFVVNGRTAEVLGERPYSWWKIALAVIVGLAIGGAVLAGLIASGALNG